MSRPGRIKVRAPRRGLANASDLDFDTAWGELESAFREIHTKNASSLSFETLYRNAYKLVLRKKGEDLYQNVVAFERKWLGETVRKNIYDLLVSTLLLDPSDQVAGGSATSLERREAGMRLLQSLKESWTDHQVAMAMLTDVLMYMDRVYCTDTRQPSIFTKAMSLFRDQILCARVSAAQDDNRTFLDILNSIILDQIHMDREGESIDKSLIKANVSMLEGLFESDSEAEDDKIYLRYFEGPFLSSSTEFYRREGERLLQESDAGTYCRHTRMRIDEELDRCRSTLSETTAPRITKVVEDELIRNKIKGLIEMDSGVQFMVNNEKHQDLALVFDLESRVDARKPELTKAIQKIIIDSGTLVNNGALALPTAQPGAPAEEGEEKAKAPVEKAVNQQTVAALRWVEDVLAMKDRFDRIWRVAFHSDQVLQSALTRSLSDVINAFNRSAEYISLFIDDNMKKGIKGKTEEEIDAVLEKAIVLLRYLQDKDVFETYYKKHLCKRLLMGRSLSIDVEKSMISRMKIELGNSFTVKLEAMFKDMTLSEELTAKYNQHIARLGEADPKRIDLSIHVLTSMTWPLETMRGLDDERDAKMRTIFPPAVEKIKTSFEKFYAQRYSGRVLSWQANMGTADIKATFPKVPSKEGTRSRTHEINVSTYAMIVLTLFNDLPAGEALTFEEIQARTNIPSNELVRNLQSLAVAPKTRILLKEPMTKDVKPTDRFVFNEAFQSKFVKIKVGVVSAANKVETDTERKVTEKKNNDSRGYVVEAAIVRIMKQRKELSHSQVLTETLTQLSGQFKPDVNMIKKKIESLIEREYMERIEEAAVPSYRYLA
ncbi:hypothetical protein AAFC00_001121 [Neodothiora populina]|uniref:Cullin family profile domain-containing protein n=1 Tax=Neodothiora populina TaxID=2781224 RepID=A0ABR3PMW0_9PEZI